MNDRLDTLVGHIEEIDHNLDSCRTQVRWDEATVRTRVSQLLRLAYEDVHELSILFQSLVECIRSMRSIPFPVTDNSQGSRALTSKEFHDVQRRSLLTSRARVLIKAIYEWLYHLKEDLESHTFFKARIPSENWLVLQRYCEFRNALVTHRHRHKLYTFAGTRMSGDYVDIELLLVPLTWSASAHKEMERAYASAIPFLPPDLAQEQNVVERMVILYRNAEALPIAQRPRIIGSLRSWGGVSDPPLALARFVAGLSGDIARIIKNSDEPLLAPHPNTR